MNQLRPIVSLVASMALLPMPAAAQKAKKAENPAAAPAAPGPMQPVSSKSASISCLPRLTLSLTVPVSSGFKPVDSTPYQGKRLEQVARDLYARFKRAGYGELGYYCLRGGGFALATQYERIRETGAPCPGNWRWNVDPAPLASCREEGWLAAVGALGRNLWRPDHGRYRTIVIYVTDGSCAESDKEGMTAAAARRMSRGLAHPPPGLTGIVTARTQITLYSYLFDRSAMTAPEAPSRLRIPVDNQLRLTGIQLTG